MTAPQHLTGSEDINDIDDLFRGYVCDHHDLLAVRRLLERAARETLGPNVLRARWLPAHRHGRWLVFLDLDPAAGEAEAAAVRALAELTPAR